MIYSQAVSIVDCLSQAVSIVEGKKSVDVGVSLCYCNSDLCNQVNLLQIFISITLVFNHTQFLMVITDVDGGPHFYCDHRTQAILRSW